MVIAAAVTGITHCINLCQDVYTLPAFYTFLAIKLIGYFEEIIINWGSDNCRFVCAENL